MESGMGQRQLRHRHCDSDTNKREVGRIANERLAMPQSCR
jgi:hypothetical protein